MRLIIMGPPGAGKGTQAAILANRLDVPAISTGELFRSYVAAGTSLGMEVMSYLARGEYVSDEVTNALVADRLSQPDTEPGFLLDGYPRTVAQVEFLDGVLGERGHKLDRILHLVVDVEKLIARLLLRAHIEGRPDDTEAVIRRRQEIYAHETAPLLAVYEDHGILAAIDGNGRVEDVAKRMLAVLEM